MHVVKEFYDHQGRIFASSVVQSEKSLLMNVWGGDIVQSENISAVLNHNLEQIKQGGLKHWLCDVCNLEGDFSEIVGAAELGLKRILESGNIEKFAFISRRANNAERMQLVKMLRQHGVEVQTFASLSRALEWLVVPDIEEDIWDEAELLTY